MNETPQTPPIAPQPPLTPPVQPPTNPPVAPPQSPAGPPQPPVPGTHNQSQQPQTDIFGIISLVMVILVLHLPGFILGLIGASKAKREGRSPVLSRVGWIVNLIFMIITIITITILVIVGLAAESNNPSIESTNTRSSTSSDTSEAETTSTTHRVTSEGFSLVVPKTFEDVPEEYRSADAIYTQGDELSQEYVLAIKESRGDFSEGMTLQDYADLINDNNYRSGTAVTGAVVSALQGVSNPLGYDVADYQITGTAGSIRVNYYVRYIATAESFYQLVTWTIPSKVSVAKPTLVGILESFREQ